ncbi:MAG: hypothetical protein QW818_02485 [Candidatus Aenigmatarchaeota archaeon]
MEVGLNLSNYQNLTVVKAATPEELKDLLDQLHLPFKIISIIVHQGQVVAFIVPSRPVRFKKKTKGE